MIILQYLLTLIPANFSICRVLLNIVPEVKIDENMVSIDIICLIIKAFLNIAFLVDIYYIYTLTFHSGGSCSLDKFFVVFELFYKKVAILRSVLE